MARKPDFERLRRTLFCEKADAVPLAELFHDIEVMDALMGREVNTTHDLVEFYIKAGYDYVPVSCDRWFSGIRTAEQETISSQAYRRNRQRRRLFSVHVDEHSPIKDFAEYKRYDWSRHGWLHGNGDTSYLDYVADMIPPEMNLIAWSDGIYEFFTKNIGYETFCYALYDDLDFVEAVFNDVGERAVNAYARIAAHPAVGAIWLADDIGYTEGMLWSPELMRKYLFPHYRKIGAIAKRYNIPFIFHSDGRLWDVVPDLIDAGINAIQPIEPKAWNAVEIQQAYGGRLCIIGTIDLDLLCRGTRGEIVEMVKKHIDSLSPQGGFVIGSSNTPTYYMNQDNYKAMLETALEYGVYPIG